MTKKEVFRCIAFVLVVCCLLVVMCDLFEQDDPNYASRFYSYRNFEKDTVDAVYFGTSGVDRYWIGAKAYEDYGMTVYPLVVDAMPVWLYKVMVDEAMTYQNPELLIFDLRSFGQDHFAENADVRGRRVLDAMKLFSVNRMKAAFKTMEVIHSLDETQPEFDMSYILPFFKFHTKWAEEAFRIEIAVTEDVHPYGGFYIHSQLSVLKEPQEVVEYDLDYYEELDPLSEKSLYELLDYTKELGIQVLFVDTPQFMTKKEIGRANTVRKILDERGVPCVSYNTPGALEELNCDLNLETDFYNEGHTNFYGAVKFTDSLADYLDSHYDFADHRNDEDVKKDWDGIYDAITSIVAKYEKKK